MTANDILSHKRGRLHFGVTRLYAGEGQCAEIQECGSVRTLLQLEEELHGLGSRTSVLGNRS